MPVTTNYKFSDFARDVEAARNKIRAGGYPQISAKLYNLFLEQDKIYPSFNLKVMYAQGAHETSYYFSNFWVESNNPVGMRAPNTRKIYAGTRNCGVEGCFATYKNRVDGWADYILRQIQYGIQLGGSTPQYMEKTIASGFDKGLPSAYAKAWQRNYERIWGEKQPDISTWKEEPPAVDILSDSQEKAIKNAIWGGLKLTGVVVLGAIFLVVYKIFK